MCTDPLPQSERERRLIAVVTGLIVLAIFVYEHAILRPSDLSRLDVAFFSLNGYVSLIYFAATLAQVLVG